MKTVASYLRVIGFIVIAFLLLEFTTESGALSTIAENPIIWAILGMVLLFAIAMEIIVEALKSILYRGLDSDAQKKYMEAEKLREDNRFIGIKKRYKNLLDSKPVEVEDEIVLDHNYDGIKELDNNLPPWWVYLFYATILFAVVYLVRFEVLGDYTQAEEYEVAVTEAKAAIAEYKKTAKGLVDASTVELLTETSDLAAGKTIFTASCVVCHKVDGGGGIGPNLTDEYWILGGGVKDIFTTISEGGRDGKGMVSWKAELKPLEIAQVTSYLLTFQGTTPAEPKQAEGEIWINPDAPNVDVKEEVEAEVIDSTVVSEKSTTN